VWEKTVRYVGVDGDTGGQVDYYRFRARCTRPIQSHGPYRSGRTESLRLTLGGSAAESGGFPGLCHTHGPEWLSEKTRARPACSREVSGDIDHHVGAAEL